MSAMSAELVHVQIAARDAEVMTTFYTRVCGWDPTAVTERYLFLHEPASGVSIGLAEEGESRFVPTLAVPDVHAFLADVEANGGSRLSDPVEVPGIGLVASFRDPEDQPVMIVPQEDDPGSAPINPAS